MAFLSKPISQQPKRRSGMTDLATFNQPAKGGSGPRLAYHTCVREFEELEILWDVKSNGMIIVWEGEGGPISKFVTIAQVAYRLVLIQTRATV